MLKRNNIGAGAHLVACLTDSVMKLIVLGTTQALVKAAYLFENLTSVRGMKE